MAHYPLPPLPPGEGRGEGKKPHRRITIQARGLRQNQTDAEKVFWNHVKAKRLEGYKFRRQHPIGQYITDFACLECMLIVEIDGGQHTEEKDRQRTQTLQQKGFHVLRFWNNEIFDNIEGVLHALSLTLSRRERELAGISSTRDTK